MGRKSTLTEKQWVAISGKTNWHELFASLQSMRNDEKAVILMLKLMLIFDDLHCAWGLPKIERYRWEFPVEGGRIDLVLFHVDGSVSLVEAKAQGSGREIAAGIGQLCMYAVAFPLALKNAKRPTCIRRILCAPIAPEKSLSLVAACNMAGVTFAHLGLVDYFKAQVDAINLQEA
jgi:hypothetical protein